MCEDGHTLVLLCRGLLFDCMQNILSPPDFIKATECLVLTKGRWKLTTFERQRNGLTYSCPGVCGKKLCVNNAYSERREEKSSRVHLNHLFKPFKQTWMMFFPFFFFFFAPPWGALQSNHMNLLHFLTGVVTSVAELEQSTAVQ